MSARIAAVTGGAGFIGRHLVAALAAEGAEVRVLDLSPPPPGLPPLVRYTRGSILDERLCAQVFDGADEIYHLAGLAHLWAPDRNLFDVVNAQGTRTVLNASRGCGNARMVVTSTEVILRGWQDPAREIREFEPLPAPETLAGPYTRSKARAHAMALAAIDEGRDVRIVYPTVPVGPGDDAFTSPTAMIRDFLLRPPPAFLDCRLNLVAVGDVVAGHLLAARKGRQGGRYILGGQDLWMHEILALLEAISGEPMPKRRIPFALALAAGVVSTAIADWVTHAPPQAPLEGVRLARVPRDVIIDAARAELGYAPGPVREALRAAVAWLIEKGHVAKTLDLRAPQTAKRAP